MQESPSDTKNMANALARVCEGHVSELSCTGRVHIWREARQFHRVAESAQDEQHF